MKYFAQWQKQQAAAREASRAARREEYKAGTLRLMLRED